MKLQLLWLKINNMFLELSGNTMMGKIVGLLIEIARYVGIGVLAIGIFQFVMALKDEDAQGKSKAILLIIAGVVMFSMGAIFKGVLGGDTGITIDESVKI